MGPVSKNIGRLERDNEVYVDLFMRASTTGKRGVEVKVSYNLGGYSCYLSTEEVLDTVEPFEVTRTVTSLKHGLPLATAFTDEPFLLLPEIKSLSEHDLVVMDSWLEPRAPVRLVGGGASPPSQLTGVEVTKDAVCRECKPLIIKAEDLPSNCLDVQDLSLGKYVVKWRRREGSFDDSEEDRNDSAAAAVSDFDMTTLKVSKSSVYVTASLPPYGVVRTPMHL